MPSEAAIRGGELSVSSMSACLLTPAIISDTHLGVALEHLAPELDVLQPLVEVVDDVLVINFHNHVTISKVPLVVVPEGLIGLLGDAAQISSGFGTRARRLEVVDKGGAKILPAVDGAGSKTFQQVQCLVTHHHREVGHRDVVVAVSSMYSDGVGAEPHLGVGVAVELVDATGLNVECHEIP
jgi:hypothetical protein